MKKVSMIGFLLLFIISSFGFAYNDEPNIWAEESVDELKSSKSVLIKHCSIRI